MKNPFRKIFSPGNPEPTLKPQVVSDDVAGAEEEPVCHCRKVYRADLVRVIKLDAVDSVAHVQELTGATGGCGCCRLDVEQLMRDCGVEPTDAW